MARKPHTNHYIYKTTCNITGNFYVGMHSTSNINDKYLGSGTRLRRSLNKHGRENHTLEILEEYKTREELVNREVELVNGDFIKDPKCMNLKLGGEGGNTGINGIHLGGDGFKNAIKYWSIPENKARLSKINSEVQLKKLEDPIYKAKLIAQRNFTGKTHSEETKRTIGDKNSIKQIGEGNSQFGTIWITNGIENKKISKQDLESYPNWKRGRIIKYASFV